MIRAIDGTALIPLDKCPFCGKNTCLNIVKKEYKGDSVLGYAIICDYLKGGCGASGGHRKTKEDAAISWNNRADGRSIEERFLHKTEYVRVGDHYEKV